MAYETLRRRLAPPVHEQGRKFALPAGPSTSGWAAQSEA